jgi:hypothetical protein
MENVSNQIGNVITFIRRYREMEKSGLAYGYALIDQLVDDQSLRRHLQGHWKGKKKGFGQFFLNLSYKNQIKLIMLLGISDPQDIEFLNKGFNSVEEEIFARPVGFVLNAHSLLLYFENNGINRTPEIGISDAMLPSSARRYGNSANWGDFCLKHPEVAVKILIKSINT